MREHETSVVRLCSRRDVVEGTPISVTVEGYACKLAVYNVGDEFFVTDNRCTHGMATLTDGYQEGGIIECPFHGGAFDIRTGAVAAAPCSTPIKTYSVTIEEGWICVSTDQLQISDNRPI